MSSATVQWFAKFSDEEQNQWLVDTVDELFLLLAKELGAAGHPTIVDRAWLETLLPSHVIFRGVQSQERLKSLLYGDLHISNGQYMGAGIYACRSDDPSIARHCASSYAALGGEDGMVVELGLAPGAVLGVWADVRDLRDKAQDDLESLYRALRDFRIAHGAATSEINELDRTYVAAKALYNDVGRFALSHGWDALVQVGNVQFPDEYIILNRSKLLIVQ